MAKLLIALDSSKGAWRAVEYVAQTFGKTPGVQVTLLHILSGLPPAFWDDGHILQEKERDSRQRLVAAWQQDQEKQWQELVHKANQHLGAAGLAPKAVHHKFKPKYFDVAEDTSTKPGRVLTTPWSWAAAGWGWPNLCSWAASPARWWIMPRAVP